MVLIKSGKENENKGKPEENGYIVDLVGRYFGLFHVFAFLIAKNENSCVNITQLASPQSMNSFAFKSK